jgi:hypothetical protein
VTVLDSEWWDVSWDLNLQFDTYWQIFWSRDDVRSIATTLQAAPNGVRIFQGEGNDYLLQNFQAGFGDRPGLHSVVTGILSREIEAARSVNFTTYIHLMPRLRMSGVIPLIPLYAVMAWKGTSSPHLTLVWWKLLLRSPVTFRNFPPNKLPDRTAPRFRRQ